MDRPLRLDEEKETAQIVRMTVPVREEALA
jgi:hypothetical protein